MLTHEKLATVSHLEAVRTPAETYIRFYDMHNERTLSENGLSVVLSRVLHFDEVDDRSTHITVVQNNSSLMAPIRLGRNRFNAPEHYVPYDADDFLVNVTDGVTIKSYDVLSVHGLYKAHLNGIDAVYHPVNETMSVVFKHDADVKHSSASFNAETGDGIVQLAGNATGWILSDVESRELAIQSQLEPEDIELKSTA